MSLTLPRNRRATVLPMVYAWVNHMACSASAFREAATVGSPMTTILLSIPDIRTPTVVTVNTVHLYCKSLSSE